MRVAFLVVAGLILFVAVVALAMWSLRRQRRLYPRERERVGDPADGGNRFTGVGMVEQFRDEQRR